MSENVNTSRNEFKLKGTPASPGSAIGVARLYEKKKFDVESSTIQREQVLEHINEFKKGRSIVEEELTQLKEEEVDREARDILNAQIEMINDPDLADRVENLIKNKLYSVDLAILKVFNTYIKLISDSTSDQFRERSIDISDLRDRLLEVVNEHNETESYGNDCVVVTKDLSPRQVISLMKNDIAGIVMEGGGTTSHATIIARSVGLPTIVGVEGATGQVPNGCKVAVDGKSGEVVICPEEKTVKRYKQRIRQERKELNRVYKVISDEAVTSDGHPFELRANIEFAEELQQAEKVGAKGIGLLRAESIYLEREHFQDIRQQESFYSTILQGTGSHPVTIRLFDAGGDKIIADLNEEDNPFLGWRGLRMLLDERSLFRDQLEAILTVAGNYPGRVSILIPMVTAVEEVQEVKSEIDSIQEKLQREGKDIDPDVDIGIMVEVPSVALLADRFISLVDFLSIGTNDLAQYTLAVDRGNGRISHLYDQRHPAIWKLIRQSVEAAESHGKKVALCGELASDPVSSACLLGMGISDLSMMPSRIPHVKELLVKRPLEEMRKLAGKVLDCSSLTEVDHLFNQWTNN